MDTLFVPFTYFCTNQLISNSPCLNRVPNNCTKSTVSCLPKWSSICLSNVSDSWLSTRLIAIPAFPNLPVLPILWRYVSQSALRAMSTGRSKFTTTVTCSTSIPVRMNTDVKMISLVSTMVLKIWTMLNTKRKQSNWTNLTTSHVFCVSKRTKLLKKNTRLRLHADQQNLKTTSLENEPFPYKMNRSHDKLVMQGIPNSNHVTLFRDTIVQVNHGKYDKISKAYRSLLVF